MERIEMQLVHSRFFTRWPCTFCGGVTEKVAILCEGSTPEGLEIRASERCLHAGQDRLAARLQENAKELEDTAAFLRTLVGRVSLPSFAEWEAAEEAYNDERLAEYGDYKALEPEALEPTEEIPF